MEPVLDEHDLKSLFEGSKQRTIYVEPEKPKPAAPPAGSQVLNEPQHERAESLVSEGQALAETSKDEKRKTLLANIRQSVLKFGTIFIFVFILTFTIINSSALLKKFSYFWNVTYNKSTATVKQTAPAFDATANAILDIPKISVNAPIAWNAVEPESYQKLLDGVVHYKGTALPGQNGNVFIYGHSSYYAWVNSSYKDVFALLDKLSVGDKIYIRYNSVTYTYEVIDSKVISPNKIEVLKSTGESIVTLMTCVPIGTNLNRLVVTAKQVSPNVSS